MRAFKANAALILTDSTITTKLNLMCFREEKFDVRFVKESVSLVSLTFWLQKCHFRSPFLYLIFGVSSSLNRTIQCI